MPSLMVATFCPSFSIVSPSVWKMIWSRFSSLQEAQVTRTRARLPCWVMTLIPQSAMLVLHTAQRYRFACERSSSGRSIDSV